MLHTVSPSFSPSVNSPGLFPGWSQPDSLPIADSPPWFQQRAAAAWKEFLALPTPAIKDEAWRYSNAKSLALESLRPAVGATDAEKRDAIARSKGVDKLAAKFVFLNDELIHTDTTALAQDVQCLPFAEALRTQGDVLEQYFMKRPTPLGGEKFAALHLAHVRAGVVVLVPKNAVIDQPIEIFHWVAGENALVFPHTLIVTGEYAQVTVVDHPLSLRSEASGSIAVADLVAGRGSRITYVNSQELSRSARALHISSTTVGRDAEVKALQLQLGAAFSRSESVSDLVGEGARSDMLGVSLPGEEQVVDMRTLQHHAAPRAMSDLLYKNALYDKSKTVFSGLITVDEGAHFTDAYQKCRNLLNSAECEADSMPGLEINADQVKCSHGTTSAPISEDELFYLKARGIPDRDSRRLIATGFLEDVIAKLDNDLLAMHLDERIEEKFARMA
ncbi:MAG: Fe-S cluster assembly protein SufD [Roseimicrobium sp.]